MKRPLLFLAILVLALPFLSWLLVQLYPAGPKVNRQVDSLFAAPEPPAATLEAWVKLKSYDHCPVLAEVEGYRLGLACAGSHRTFSGTLVFAGEALPGAAYGSGRDVPLGRWVHLAATYAPRRGVRHFIDGREATLHQGSSFAGLARGGDPWAEARAVCNRWQKRGWSTEAECRAIGTLRSGAVGETRLARRAKTLPEITAGMGQDGRFEPAPPPKPGDLGSAKSAPRPEGRAPLTRRGLLLTLGFFALSALAVALGLALLRSQNRIGYGR